MYPPKPKPPAMTQAEKRAFDAAAREHARLSEQQILTYLQELAQDYDRLRQSLRQEAERFQRLTEQRDRDPAAKHGEAAGHVAVEMARTALQDLPRATTLFLLQNPELYTSIVRAGGVRLWAQALSENASANKPLPRLLEMLDEALRCLQNREI